MEFAGVIVIYTAMSQVGTAITAHCGASPSIHLRPAGHDADTGANKTYWGNITMGGGDERSDGGGGTGYIGTHEMTVTVWIQDTQSDLDSTTQSISTKVAAVRDALRFNTLGTYCRGGIRPEDMSPGHPVSHSDESSRYGYSFTVRVAHQY